MTLLETGWRAAGHLLGRPRSLSWPSPRATPAAGVLHGASAGEVKGALALAPFLPGSDWIVTSGTAAGLAVGAAGRLPRDAPASVTAFFEVVRPRRIVLVEGDLWPVLLGEAARRGVPVGVAGARLSPRSLRWWRRAPRSARRLLDRVAGFAAASAGDAERLVEAGAAPDRVEACGWLKWCEPPGPDQVARRRGELTEGSGAPLVVAGSVHPGELSELAAAFRSCGLDPSTHRWLIAPRHASTSRRVAVEARRCLGPAVRVEERFGVLRSWYGVADLAFVGGGARGRGVHDLLEPLALGRRPIFFADRGDPAGIGDVLCARGGAVRLDGATPGAVGEALGVPVCEPSALRARFDGRGPAVTFLTKQGVLPPPRASAGG